MLGGAQQTRSDPLDYKVDGEPRIYTNDEMVSVLIKFWRTRNILAHIYTFYGACSGSLNSLDN